MQRWAGILSSESRNGEAFGCTQINGIQPVALEKQLGLPDGRYTRFSLHNQPRIFGYWRLWLSKDQLYAWAISAF